MVHCDIRTIVKRGNLVVYCQEQCWQLARVVQVTEHSVVVRDLKHAHTWIVGLSSVCVVPEHSTPTELLHFRLEEPTLLYTIQTMHQVHKQFLDTPFGLLQVNPLTESMMPSRSIFNQTQPFPLHLPENILIVDEMLSELHLNYQHTVLLTGASGSGKSATCRVLLEYLGHRLHRLYQQQQHFIHFIPPANRITNKTESEAAKSKQTEPSAQPQPTHTPEEIIRKILHGTNLLDAVGGCKTQASVCSSPAAKFITLIVDPETYTPVAATVEAYLLDQFRVIKPKLCGGRNFSIFYLLLAAPTPFKDSLFIRFPPGFYRLLNPESAVSKQDELSFKLVQTALAELGVSEKQAVMFWRIIASILLLGNIEFEHTRSNFVASEEFYHGCEMLQLDTEKLLDVITRDGEANLAECTDNWDAFLANVYHNTFAWLVAKINATLRGSLQTNTNMASITLIDIPGVQVGNELMENTHPSGLTELTYRMLSDEVAYYVNKDSYRQELEKYNLESVTPPDALQKYQNHPYMSKPNIVFIDMLQGEGVDSTGTLVMLLKSLQGVAPCDINPKGFVWHHTTLDVEYELEHFVLTCKHKPTITFSDIVRSGADPHLYTMLAEDLPFVPESCRAVSNRLEDLLGGNTGFQVCRCICTVTHPTLNSQSAKLSKNNSSSTEYDAQLVKQQLDIVGLRFLADMRSLRDTLTIPNPEDHNAGYPIRIPIHIFAEQYRVVLRTQDPNYEWGMHELDVVVGLIQLLPEDLKFGTKIVGDSVWLTAYNFATLEGCRIEIAREDIVTVQMFMRSLLAAKELYTRSYSTTRKLQTQVTKKENWAHLFDSEIVHRRMVHASEKDNWRTLLLGCENDKIRIKLEAEEAKKERIRKKQEAENRLHMQHFKEEKALRDQSATQRMEYQRERLNKIKETMTNKLSQTLEKSQEKKKVEQDPQQRAIQQKAKDTMGQTQLTQKLKEKEQKRTQRLLDQQQKIEEWTREEEERKHMKMMAVQQRKKIVADWQEEMKLKSNLDALEFQIQKKVEREFAAKKQQAKQQEAVERDRKKREIQDKIVKAQKRQAQIDLNREKEQERQKREAEERFKRQQQTEWAKLQKERDLLQKKAKREQQLDSIQRTKERVEMKKLLKEAGLPIY